MEKAKISPRSMKNSTFATVSISLVVASTNIQAEETGTKAVNLTEVTVTGELQDRTLQETQTSVTLITGEELEERAEFDLYNVIERTPGVVSAFGNKGFSIRGIDQRGVGGAGNGLTVSTTVDGATISNSNQLSFFGPYSTWDLEQIEILKGPQSTQQGRNALAGAINIRSKDPVYEYEMKARLEAGDVGTFGTAVAVNAPLIDKVLAVRFAAEKQQNDGFISNPTQGTDEFDAKELTTGRFSVRFDPADNLDAILKVSFSENQAGEDVVDSSLFPDQRVNFSDAFSEEGARIHSYNLRLGYDINDAIRIESETTYLDANYYRVEDTDSSAFPAGVIFRNADVENIQQEFRLRLDQGRWRAVVGAFYTDISDVAPAGGTVAAELFNPGFAGLGATIDAVIDADTQTENYALFGELEFDVTERLSLIGGLRYDHESFSTTTTNGFTSTNPIVASFLPPTTTETNDTSFNALLPKLGVVYDINDVVSLGFTVQQGYRAGGTSVNLATGNRQDFDPEKTWNYEASLRSTWFDQRLIANANIFYTDWEDQQVEVINPISGNPLDSNTFNAGSSQLYGGEVELYAYPSDALEMYASLAYVHTEFEEFITGTDDFSGNEFPFAPELTAAAGATYYFNNGFFLSGDFSFKDDMFADSANDEVLKAEDRFLVNLRAGYLGQGWKIFAYARNLFDEDYVTQGVSGGLDNNGRTILSGVRAGEQRVVGMVAQVNFDLLD